ncbi:hypothetical protein KI655_18450 [Vibrio sp. D404a]|uniref:hypothetical protein n=1 Tax=unclassified Vibrio TaxID=2614977 RepID=UPI0025560486|nr:MULTISPECIES: hypothetical protein [unclassified Vibrio]MDK9739279.1 hypothetical protein [Vibrio sp. D404a]MDK9797685.1 hypothetical protein [Vibrio sp. D449a]
MSENDERALPGTGPLSMSQVNVELGHDSDDTISLNQSDVRQLAGKPSGAIAFSDLRGKSSNLLQTTMVGRTYDNGQCGGPGGHGVIYSGFTRYTDNVAWKNLGSMGKNTFTDPAGRARTIYGIMVHKSAPANMCGGANVVFYVQLNQIKSNSGWTKITVQGIDPPSDNDDGNLNIRHEYARTSMTHRTGTHSGRAVDEWYVSLTPGDRLVGNFDITLE